MKRDDLGRLLRGLSGGFVVGAFVAVVMRQPQVAIADALIGLVLVQLSRAVESK